VKHLGKNDLLLGDRAFGSYQLISHCLAQGAHVLMRLHQARDRALDWKKNCQAYIEFADEMMRKKQGRVRMKLEINKGI